MENYKDFEKYKKRLNSLDDDIRSRALQYASEFYADHDLSREEALEKGISKAELKKRDL